MKRLLYENQAVTIQGATTNSLQIHRTDTQPYQLSHLIAGVTSLFFLKPNLCVSWRVCYVHSRIVDLYHATYNNVNAKASFLHKHINEQIQCFGKHFNYMSMRSGQFHKCSVSLSCWVKHERLNWSRSSLTLRIKTNRFHVSFTNISGVPISHTTVVSGHLWKTPIIKNVGCTSCSTDCMHASLSRTDLWISRNCGDMHIAFTVNCSFWSLPYCPQLRIKHSTRPDSKPHSFGLTLSGFHLSLDHRPDHKPAMFPFDVAFSDVCSHFCLFRVLSCLLKSARGIAHCTMMSINGCRLTTQIVLGYHIR